MAKKVSELIAEADAAVDALQVRSDAEEAIDQQDITNLQTEVARLQAIIDAGEATPADEAAFAALNTKLNALIAAQA